MDTTHFARWVLDDGLSLSALSRSGAPLCGVYVLEFVDGTECVGQTVSLPQRLAAHRRRWPGEVVALRFASVPGDGLDQVERDVMSTLERDGHRLRNVDLVGLPLRSEALDFVVDPAVQQEWLDGRVDPLVIGEWGHEAIRRRRSWERYRELARRPDHGPIVERLADYVATCLPWPHQTEARFWTVTSLPATGRTDRWRRVAVLSVNNVEVLVIGEWRADGGPWVPEGFVNVAAHTRTPKGVRAYETAYRSTGDVLRLEFGEPRELASLLREPEVARGARELAIGLLRKGKGMLARFHDYNLADDVFIALDARSRQADGGVEQSGLDT